MAKFGKLAAQTALASSALAMSLWSVQARAEDEPASPFTMAANVGVFSDYRFRGVSLNEENIAVQGGFDFGYAVNDTFKLYLGVWGSSLSPRGVDEGNIFGGQEIDIYGGVTAALGAATVKLGAIGYVYPSGEGSLANYYELNAEVSGALGPATLTGGVFFAPKQENYGDKSALYFYGKAAAAIPGTPFTLLGGVGHESGGVVEAFGFNNKIDWNLGAAATYKQFTFTLQYVDTNKTVTDLRGGPNAAGGTIVAQLVAAF